MTTTLEKLLSGLNWSNSRSYGSYRFVPITGKIGAENLVQLAKEGIDGLQVSELESESVNFINMESSYEYPLLVISGIVLEGGKQTRSPTRPFIIHKGKKRKISVNCVEQQRWAYTPENKVAENEKAFKFSNNIVSQKTRSTLTSLSAPQMSTWTSIGNMRAAYNLNNEEAMSQSYLEIEKIAKEKSKEKVDEIKNEIQDAFSVIEQRGMVIFEGNKLISVEVFDQPRLWDDLKENLLDSNITDLLSEEESSADFEDDQGDLAHLSMESTDPLADETAFMLKKDDLEGWAIGMGDDLVYLVCNRVQEDLNHQPMIQEIAQTNYMNVAAEEFPPVQQELEEE